MVCYFLARLPFEAIFNPALFRHTGYCHLAPKVTLWNCLFGEPLEQSYLHAE
jgi:hypothetical protein